MKASYKWYLLALLLLIDAFSAVDRLALGLLTQDIKHDLSLTDTELGALDGFAFSLFYAFMGIPIAYWVDRGHRGKILAVTTALWSAAVMLGSAARSFVQLAFTRVIAAVGEAGLDPNKASLVPQYFDRSERARAMTISGLANPLGTVLGYGVAGWIAQHYGWRLTFAVLGVPGLLLAGLAARTVREPRRALAAPECSELQGRLLSLAGLWPAGMTLLKNTWQAAVTLRKNASFRHLTMSAVVEVFFSYGIYAWLPAFFARSYGMKDAELGGWLTVTNGVAGFVAVYLGGELAHRFGRNKEPLQIKVMAALVVLSTFTLGGVFLTHNKYVALGAMTAFLVLQLPAQGPLSAISLTVVPQRLRATSVALVSVAASLIGMGIGPLVGGILSDLFHPFFGEESLRYALLVMTPGYLWCAWQLWATHRTFLHDASVAELDSQGASGEEGAAA